MSALPQLYERWMEELSLGELPRESHATCQDCAMCSEDPDPSEQLFFDSLSRCCTFLPEMPNFQVGLALADRDPENEAGRKTLVERIAMRRGVTPLGLSRDLSYALRYRHRGDSFGRDTSLRCPHQLDDGRCGVWRYRESTCATWFCKHERGDLGLRFWRELHRFLSVLEQKISYWCTRSLGLDNESIAAIFEAGPHPIWTNPARGSLPGYVNHLLGTQLDSVPLKVRGLGRRSNAAHEALWGEWIGRESELYVACAELVKHLSIGDLCERAEIDLESEVRELRARHASVASRQVPDRMVNGEWDLVQLGGRRFVRAYSRYDPLEVSDDVLSVLPHFDGTPTHTVVANLREARGLEMTEGLLSRLMDFGVLKDADD